MQRDRKTLPLDDDPLDRGRLGLGRGSGHHGTPALDTGPDLPETVDAGLQPVEPRQRDRRGEMLGEEVDRAPGDGGNQAVFGRKLIQELHHAGRGPRRQRRINDGGQGSIEIKQQHRTRRVRAQRRDQIRQHRISHEFTGRRSCREGRRVSQLSWRRSY